MPLDARQFPYLLLVTVLILPLALPWGALGSTGDATGPVVENKGAEPLQVDYTVGFMTTPAGLELEIDGIAYETPIEFVWEEGELHMIAAPSPQYDGDRTRYVWSTWSDFGARVHAIVVVGDENYTAFYEIEYLVTLTTDPMALEIVIDGMPYMTPVQFWFTSGASTILAAPAEVYVGNLTRYVFVHWVADPWIPEPLNVTTIVLTVTSPQNLTAVYQLQYSLFYDVPWEMLPTNCEWYDDGTSAYASLDSPYYYASPDVRLVFDHWGGDVSGTNYSQSDPILMDGPKTALTFWTKQYRLTFGGLGPMPGLIVIVDGINYTMPVTFWWDDGSTHTIEVPDQQVTPTTRYKFAGWLNENCFGNPCILIVFLPGTYMPLWTIQYLITVETVPSGLSFSLDSVDHTAPESFWLDEGSAHLLETTSPQSPSAGTTYEWQSWSDGGETAHSITVFAPATYTAYFGTQYEISFIGPAGLAVEVDNVSYTMPFSLWCDEGTSHSVFFPSPQGVDPQIRAGFLYWTDPSFLGNPATLVCDGPKSTSVVVETQYRVDLDTSPMGLNLSVDGIPYTAPVSFWWDADSPHNVYAPDYPPDCWWHHWSDGGEQGHDIVVTGPMTITAHYGTQHEISFLGPADLTVEIDNVSYTMPFSFWCDEGASHFIHFPSPQAVGPQTRVEFLSWTDPGFLGNPAIVVCDGPKSTMVEVETQYMVNITSVPVGLDIEADGVVFITPYSTWWDADTFHYLHAPDHQDFLWHHWSDGGEQGHIIEATGPMTITAYYIYGLKVTITAEPLVPVLEVDGVQCAPPAVFRWEYNTLHTISAPSPQMTPNGTLYFSHWSDGGAQSHTIAVDGTDTYVAYYTGTVHVTIDTLPTFQEILVDGMPYITPRLFYWDIGSVHAVEAHELIAVGQNASLRFSHWSDGGSRSHDIVIEESGAFVAHYDRFYRVGLDTVPSGLNLSVNGTMLTAPAHFWWREGYTVELEAISPQEHNGTRHLFIMWADGYYLPKRTIVVSGAVTYVALYKPQHYLSVIIPPPLVSFGPVSVGAGWYDDGSLATAGLAVPEFEYDSGRRWVFLSWEGDASGTDFRASEPMLMDRPRTALVAWKAQFLLTVESEHGSPTGGGWYDEGSPAAVSIEEEVSIGGHVYRFQGWSGHVSTSSSWLTLRMDSPATLVAHWSEVSEEPAGNMWPILYVATTAALVSVLIVAFYFLRIRPGRRGD